MIEKNKLNVPYIVDDMMKNIPCIQFEENLQRLCFIDSKNVL